MDAIPKISDDEEFKAIDEQPGYYISNYKRIYSMKTKQIIKIDGTRFRNGKHEKIPIKPLFNRYFNQPDEMNLIAIIKYGKHKFKDIYYDKLNGKFFIFKKGIYIELIQHNHSNRKAKIIYVKDIEGKKTSISPQIIKKRFI